MIAQIEKRRKAMYADIDSILEKKKGRRQQLIQGLRGEFDEVGQDTFIAQPSLCIVVVGCLLWCCQPHLLWTGNSVPSLSCGTKYQHFVVIFCEFPLHNKTPTRLTAAIHIFVSSERLSTFSFRTTPLVVRCLNWHFRSECCIGGESMAALSVNRSLAPTY